MYGARLLAGSGIARRLIWFVSAVEHALTINKPEIATTPSTARRTRLGRCRPTNEPLSEK